MTETTIKEHFTALHQDAILWKAGYLYKAATSPDEKATAIEEIAHTVMQIKGVTRQTTYVQAIEQEIKLKKNLIAKTIEQLHKQADDARKKQQGNLLLEEEEEGIMHEQESKMPKWITKEDEMHWRKHGYFPCNKMVNDHKKIGFYSISVRQTEAGPVYASVEITNFLCTPIMHVYKGVDSRHIIEINNGYVNAVKEVESKLIPSREQFQSAAVTEGSFAIFGSNLQWLRIASDLLHKFPRCIEIDDLGWHPSGFFAYSDYIYVPGKGHLDIDRYGIVEVAEKKYLLAQQSEAYLQLIGTGGDPFENDRPLTHKKATITFTDWCNKVQRVYGMQGAVGVAFCIFTLFRDVVAKITGTSPHLYLFGPPQSGKSVLAETIYSLFYLDRKFFIAYEGTVPAFYTYMSRFVNCPAVINEVDANTTDPDRLQAFKGAFDLEGREKMNMSAKGNKRSTTIQKINSSLILVGQHIVTNDDNALLTRSIIEDFLPNDNRSSADIKAFDDLKQVGKQGITSLLTELLNMRGYFDTNFRQQYLEQLGEWIKLTSQQGKPLVQRIMNNYAILATSYKILSNNYTLPISADQFTEYCLQQAKKWSAFVSSSDTLSEFWRYISFLFESGQVVDGWDIIVKKETTITTRDGQTSTYDAGELVMYIRLNNTHKVYQAENRKRTGKDGISMDMLLHYFKAKKYFIGPIKSMRFKRFKDEVEAVAPGMLGNPHRRLKPQETIASCHAFLYSEIAKQIEGFNLIRSDIDYDEKKDEPEETSINEKNIWQPSQEW